MNILVANNHLVRTGGTENYTYAIIVELLRLGHNVEYFTFHKGAISNKIEALGVKFKSKNKYDLILANHVPVVRKLHQHGYIIQTCHGSLPGLEEPAKYADLHVSTSRYVQQYLKQRNVNSIVINNGVDCERFSTINKINANLTSVLSLCQSEKANDFIRDCCNELNVGFRKVNKSKENKWDLEQVINDVDLVVGIGRSLYDAMACGRVVISYDKRRYSRRCGDGYLNKDNVLQSLEYNCCGMTTEKTFTKESFLRELKKYDAADGDHMRDFALKELNIRISVEKYLHLYSSLTESQLKKIRIKKIMKICFLVTDFHVIFIKRIIRKVLKTLKVLIWYSPGASP